MRQRDIVTHLLDETIRRLELDDGFVKVFNEKNEMLFQANVTEFFDRDGNHYNTDGILQ